MAIKAHTPLAKFDDIPGSLPNGHLPKNIDLDAVARTSLKWLNNLSIEHLADNAIHRDLLALTDTYRTFHSPQVVLQTFKELSQNKNCSAVRIGETKPHVDEHGGWVDVPFNFTTRDDDLIGNCVGIASLIQDQHDQWKIWMLRTWLENYEGHGNPDVLDPVGAKANGQANGTSDGDDSHIYDVAVVGGGQSGLGIAGRCKALGIDHILFDNRPAIGDSWRNRYDSLKWHTIKEYGNLPLGRTFNENDENLLTKDRIGSGYQEWSEKYDLNVRTNRQVVRTDWDEGSSIWTVFTKDLTSGRETAYKAYNVVLCVGPGIRVPVSPAWASSDKIEASGFKGLVVHGAHYHNAHAWAGKRGVVIGTANTGHDVAEDMADEGMDTTMVQRNATFVFPGEWLVASQSAVYHLNQPTAVTDRAEITAPLKVSREMLNRMVWAGIKANPERFDALERAGFKVDRRGDLFEHLHVRYGGHYVDIGASGRIAKGEIKVKAAAVKGLTQKGLIFEDGSELEADVIILATGYEHDFRKDAAEIVGHEIANQMDNYWGIDKEGEIRGFAKLAGHPHLIYHGGEVRYARFYSRFVALQLQRIKLGQPLHPYTA